MARWSKENVKMLQELLSEVARKAPESLGWEGLKSHGSRCTYDPETGEIKVSLHFRVEDEETEKHAFERSCSLFGLLPEAYGAIIFLRGSQHRLVGFDLKRKRFPIVTRNSITGKVSLWERQVVRFVPAHLRVTLGVMPDTSI